MSYRRNQPRAVENYTDAFFAVFGVLLFMVMWTIAAIAGYLWVFATAWMIDRIGRLIARRIR